MRNHAMTALVIDDDAGDITLLRRTVDQLSDLRIRLLTASDSDVASTMLLEWEVDVIFLDYLLGPENGLKILKGMLARGCTVPIIMLTGMGNEETAVEAMRLGAADYLVKGSLSPEGLSRAVLNAIEKKRLHGLIEGHRKALENKVHELEEALAHVKQLQGLLPICMHCKRVREDDDRWLQIEAYIMEHSEAMFTHAVCKECLAKHYPGSRARRRNNRPFRGCRSLRRR